MRPNHLRAPGGPVRSTRRKATIAIVLVTSTLATFAVSLAPEATAQARLVNALVRTIPERPAAGDDVTVLVNVTGCAPGDVTVEIYLTTSDGATQAATLMGKAAATPTLLYRTKARLTLNDAFEGWYGARVLCGNFRPPKEAMANTLFAVGESPTKESNLAGSSVTIGGTLPFSGSGCPGSTVEYDISEGARWAGPFEPDGTIDVAADGTWSTELRFGEEISPGPVSVRSRCRAVSPAGESVELYYGGSIEVQVERAPG